MASLKKAKELPLVFYFLYEIIFGGVLVVALPWIAYQIFWRKKYRHSWLFRLGLKKVQYVRREGATVIWLHAASFGEMRALAPLYKKLRAMYPAADFCVSCITETGYAEALQALPGCAVYFYLPLDFYVLVRPLVKKIRPHLLLVCEGDLWPEMILCVKAMGTRLVLVNGKLSEKSFSRYLKWPRIAAALWGSFDLLCVQSRRHKDRLQKIASDIPIAITGNLKADHRPCGNMQRDALRRAWKIAPETKVIVLGSTHEGEEELLLESLRPLFADFPELKIFVAPRHPHRFEAVARYLQEAYGGRWTRYSDREQGSIVLIDAMGLLISCYAFSDIAIVGGSFIKGIGGHNLLEPCMFGVPILFGPYMDGQADLAQSALEAVAGLQMQGHDVGAQVRVWLQDAVLRDQAAAKAQAWYLQESGAVQATIDAMKALRVLP